MTLTFDNVVDEVARLLTSFGLAQDRCSWLSGAVGATDTTFSVTDSTGFDQGVADIGSETVYIASVDTGSLTIAPDGRGYYGTTAAAYPANTRITAAPTWPRGQIAEAINEAVTGCSPTLFGVGTTSFLWTPAQNTYAVPAEATRIIQVTTDTIGPSMEQVKLSRWSFNPNAPTGEFSTGKTVTLEEPGEPGRDITVLYAAEPKTLTWGDAFTLSGLSETAKAAVKYAAASSLSAFMDMSRLPVDSAQSDQYDSAANRLGSAAQISLQLYQRYLAELESERRRQTQRYPFTVHVRTR